MTLHLFGRHCTTRTWKCLISRFVEDVNTRRRLSFSFSWTLVQSFRIQLHKKLPTSDELNEMEQARHSLKSANSLFKWRFRSRRCRCCLSSLLTSLCSEYCLSTATQLCLTGIAIAISCGFSVIMFCSITRWNFMHYSILQEPPPPQKKKLRKWLKEKCVQRLEKLSLSIFWLPCATGLDI